MENTQYIHPSAVLMGDIKLGSQVSIWPLAVIRADMNSITIGDYTNIQDGAVLHVDDGSPLALGRHVTVGHKAVLHGCQVGDNCLVGIGAIILDGVTIGENCLIGAGTLLSPGKTIPPGSLVMGKPGRIIRNLDPGEIENIQHSAINYWRLAEKLTLENQQADPE